MVRQLCRVGWMGLAALLLLTGCGTQPPSLMLVTASGLRADALSSLHDLGTGDPGTQTWTLQTPSPESVPALCALMTGEEPWKLQTEFSDLSRLPSDVPTLAELLKKQGYATAAFVGQGEVNPLTGLARGFDTFFCPAGSLSSAVTREEAQRVKPWRTGFVMGDELVRQVTGFLRGYPQGKPLFLWVHLGDLNTLVNPTDPKSGYQKNLAGFDKVIGVLGDATRAQPLAGKTYFALASVHGLGLGEEGEMRHGLTLSPGVIKIPVILKNPRSRKEDLKPPASLTQLHDVLLSVLHQPSPGRGGPALSVTRLPERYFGWSGLALANSSSGQLMIHAAPMLQTKGGGSHGTGTWGQAPQDLREALEKAGVQPSPEGEGESSRKEILDLMSQALVFFSKGEADRAQEILEELCRRAPGALEPRVLLIRYFASQKGNEKAKAELQRVLSEITALKNLSPAQTLDRAGALILAGNPQEAILEIQSLDEKENSPGVNLGIVDILLQAKAVEAALTHLQPLLDSEKEAPELQELAGDILLSSGNAYRARVAYETALNTPRGASANLMAKLGDCLAQLNETDPALKRFAAAAKADPSYLYPHARAADLLLAQGKHDPAVQATIMSVAKIQDPILNVIHQADALEARGFLPEAATIVYEALGKNPGHLRLKVALARILAHGGKPSEGRKLLEETLKENQDFNMAWVELARLEAAAGNQTAAIAALDRAELKASAELSAEIQRDPVFQKAGEKSPLAERARRFQGKTVRGGNR